MITIQYPKSTLPIRSLSPSTNLLLKVTNDIGYHKTVKHARIIYANPITRKSFNFFTLKLSYIFNYLLLYVIFEFLIATPHRLF